MKKIRTKNNRKNNKMKRISMSVCWHRDSFHLRICLLRLRSGGGYPRSPGLGKEEESPICGHLAPEKKKQVKSAVRYRVFEATPAPEKKKQVKSAVKYWVIGSVTTPEKKK